MVLSLLFQILSSIGEKLLVTANTGDLLVTSTILVGSRLTAKFLMVH